MMTFEEELEQSGKLVYPNVGVSMRPLIKQDRDLLIIEKAKGRLKKYDIPLYKRPNGQYVLHRVVKVRENDYVILGDNCVSKEYGITDSQILGVLTSLVRNGKEVDFNSFGYKLYVRARYAHYPVRVMISRLKRLAKKILRR